MKRLLLLAMLAACGDKQDPAPAPAAVVSDVVKTPPTPLAEARQILTTTTKRDPTAWVALAHAQAVAKLPEAKSTLDAALAAARADAGREGAVALVHAVEVLDALGDASGAAKLLDEAAQRISGLSVEDELVGELLSPASHLTHAPTIDRLATLAAEPFALGTVLLRSAPAIYPVLVAKVRAVPDRRLMLLMLAAHVRRTSTPDLGLVEEAARLAETPDEKVVVAIEAALSGAPALAKKLVDGVPKLAHSLEAAERADAFAALAEIYALVGDQAGAIGFEKKALQAAEKDSEDIEGDQVWSSLAVARGKRGDVEGAIELVRDRMGDKESVGDVVHYLVEAGELAAAKRILTSVAGAPQLHATIRVVMLLVLRDLDAAKQLALESPAHGANLTGIDHVMRAYALRGDLAAVRELGVKDRAGTKTLQLDAFTDLTARTLARQGKCDDAIAAARGVTANRGECLAVIARYCPNPKR